MAKRKQRPKVNWLEVRRVKHASFLGQRLTQEETDLCVAAIEEDRERFILIEKELKEEYAQSLRLE